MQRVMDTKDSRDFAGGPGADSPLVASAKEAHLRIQDLADAAARNFAASANDAELLRIADDLQREADEAWEDVAFAEREATTELEQNSGTLAAGDEVGEETPNSRPAATGGAFETPQQNFPPRTIVRNIIDHFFRYRGLTLAAPGLSPDKAVPDFTEDRIIGDMERFQYTRIDAMREKARGVRDWVVILVLGADGRYSRHSPDLRKLLEGIETEAAAKSKRLDELIVVADLGFFSRNALTELIRHSQRTSAAARLAARTTTIDPTGVAAFYNAHPFGTFAVVVPEHKAVPQHIIMDNKESEKLLQAFWLTRTDLPTIYASDPPLIWLGAREGNIVKILRRSQTSGTSVYYRQVDRGVSPA